MLPSPWVSGETDARAIGFRYGAGVSHPFDDRPWPRSPGSGSPRWSRSVGPVYAVRNTPALLERHHPVHEVIEPVGGRMGHEDEAVGGVGGDEFQRVTAWAARAG
ncbi:hypothetical protein GCM10010376_24770 [Streptomyces violaceusniger]